ncbi:SDR family oxidoreductase [Candidatus Poribacteria bacterium]|nr:SDR family oxidoreductase [Candidatus Poribacteria bacterium]
MRFKDKTILVTGGAMGIGSATVKRLAHEGANVIMADIDEAAANERIKEIGSKRVFYQFVDLSKPDSITKMGQEVAGKFDSLNGLVNNAGIVNPTSIADTGDKDWHPQMTINLRAPALCSKSLLPLLKKGPGHIVNVSSEGGFRPRPGNWVYDASKAGICALSRTMACEFIHYGMRANTVAPGWTVTEMHFSKAEEPAKRKEELENLSYNGAIIQRLARPGEIAAAIVFLLSDDASFITGTTIHVDGGRVGN